LSVLGLELQCGRIDAVAQAGGCGAVFEQMSEVRVAGRAKHFGAAHAVTVIVLGSYRLRIEWLPVAGPAGSGVELLRGAEQGGAASDATVGSARVIVPVLPGERLLGALLADDL